MEYAWDENAYLALTLKNELPIYRLWGADIFQLLAFISCGNLDLAMILMDLLVPAFAAFLAVKTVRFYGYKNIFLPVTLLLLSISLLSFSDINFWGIWISKVSPFAKSLPNYIRSFIPDLRISFFPLYRSTDPQASLL